MNKKLGLYGHLFKDDIYYLNGFLNEGINNQCIKRVQRLGGTENFYNRFSAINKNYKIDRFEIPSEAIVLINIENGSRTSVVNWDNEPYELIPYVCDWAHLMYIDKLNINSEFLAELKKNNTIISADLCVQFHDVDSKRNLSNLFQYIDYLIVSNIELDDIRQEARKCKNLIEHAPEYVVVNEKRINNNKYSEIVKSTLGAGDFFAAEFVNNITMGYGEIDAAEKALKQSSLYVKGELR